MCVELVEVLYCVIYTFILKTSCGLKFFLKCDLLRAPNKVSSYCPNI